MKGFLRAISIVFPLSLVAVLFLPLWAAWAEQVKDLPKPTDYVSDYAHVLSPEAVARLDHICDELDHSQANAQLAIVTVRNLDGDDASDFANQLEDKWKMGKKGSDRGVLVLLAVDDHKYRIDVAYGLEGILNDAKVGDIGRSMVPYLRARDYDNAVWQSVGQVAQVIAADAKISLDDAPAPPPHRQSHGSPLTGLIVWIIIFLLFGGSGLLRFFLGYGLISSALGGRRNSGGGSFFGGSGFDGGGGGSGGGGFGGFGGGSFGGGGAGGDW